MKNYLIDAIEIFLLCAVSSAVAILLSCLYLPNHDKEYLKTIAKQNQIIKNQKQICDSLASKCKDYEFILYMLEAYPIQEIIKQQSNKSTETPNKERD